MSAYLFIKCQDRTIQDQNHLFRGLIEITELANDYSAQTLDLLFSIKSIVISSKKLRAHFGPFGTFLTATEAYNLGKSLQPDREIFDHCTDELRNFTFNLGISAEELSEQCDNDIADYGERKAHSLGLKNNRTQEEDDHIDYFMSKRETRRNQHATDKTTLGF